MPKIFSARTLAAFEDASASIPLRQIDRAFTGANIHPGAFTGEADGARRKQFRRYIAGVNQRDPQHLVALGNALGALIGEVAESKIEFLVNAAERDGFFFADGALRPADGTSPVVAVTRVEEFVTIDDRGRQLQLLANDRSSDAIDGAEELVRSVCRTVLARIGGQSVGKGAGLGELVTFTLRCIERVSAAAGEAEDDAVLIRGCLEQLSAVVSALGEVRMTRGTGLPSRYARLAVGAAVALAAFIAHTYVESTPPSS